MNRIITALAFALLAMSSLAQAPRRPLLPLNTWTLPGYEAIDASEAFKLPADVKFDSVTGATFTAAGHLLVLQRGPQPILEFDGEGNFIRVMGENLGFARSHGLRVDDEGNIWVTDVAAHWVRKLDKDGNILMTLGTPGENGSWNETAGLHLFDQPNETALDSQGNIYVAQGHLAATPRILKFSQDGTFVKQWGGWGNGQGQFLAAHSIEIDDNDNIYVADRENRRIQIFDTEGNYVNEWTYTAMVCAIYLHTDGFLWMTSGFDGEFAKIDMATGNLVGSLGRSGNGNGEFGEAHYLTLDGDDNVFIADVINRRVQKFEKQ